MEICEECDIVYNNKYCPLCMANERIEELESEVETLKEEIKNMEVA